MGRLAIKLILFLFLGLILIEGRAEVGTKKMTSKTASGLKLGKLAVGGPGCLDGSVQAILGGEESEYELSLIFDDLYIYAKDEDRSIKRLSCSLALPFRVAKHKALIVERTELWSILFLEEGDSAKITSETFLAGQLGEKQEQTYQGEFSGFEMLGQEESLSTVCGEEGILRNNTTLLQKASAGGNSFSMIDGVHLKIRVVDCD